MNYLEYFRLAVRALRTNKIRSMLTMLGIIIGVASVILLVSIGTGLQYYIAAQFATLGSDKIFVLPGKVDLRQMGPPTNQVSKFDLADLTAIKRDSSVIRDATGAIIQTNVITYKGKIVNVPTIGVQANYFSMLNFSADAGTLFTQSDVERSRKIILLGPKVAQDLFGDADPAGKFVVVGDVRYLVTGVLAAKGSGGSIGNDLDNRTYIPYTTGLRQFNQTRPYMLIVGASRDTVDQATDDVKRTLARRLRPDDFTVLQQTELLNTINQFLSAITVALGGIAAISLLVGGIGIMNIMLVSVTERTREIGLRKAVGATPTDILLQFLIEAVILSLLGGIVGIILGFLGSLAISQIIKTYVTVWSVLLASGFSAVIGVIFGVAPAIRASRLDPIDALRYE